MDNTFFEMVNGRVEHALEYMHSCLKIIQGSRSGTLKSTIVVSMFINREDHWQASHTGAMVLGGEGRKRDDH